MQLLHMMEIISQQRHVMNIVTFKMELNMLIGTYLQKMNCI